MQLTKQQEQSNKNKEHLLLPAVCFPWRLPESLGRISPPGKTLPLGALNRCSAMSIGPNLSKMLVRRKEPCLLLDVFVPCLVDLRLHWKPQSCANLKQLTHPMMLVSRVTGLFSPLGVPFFQMWISGHYCTTGIYWVNQFL